MFVQWTAVPRRYGVFAFREAGLFTVPLGVAWVDDSLVFSAAGAQGIGLYRQRLAASTFQPACAPERLTAGGEAAWLPTAAAGRLAFLSLRADSNLWSVALEAPSGLAQGSPRRMTRGPLPTGFLTVTNDPPRAYLVSTRDCGHLPESSPTPVGEGSRRRTCRRDRVSAISPR